MRRAHVGVRQQQIRCAAFRRVGKGGPDALIDARCRLRRAHAGLALPKVHDVRCVRVGTAERAPCRCGEGFGRLCPPSYGAWLSSTLIGWVWGAGVGGAAARGAMRSAARRRGGRSAQGLASGNSCCSQHHLISGRTGLVRTHIPHACGEEATGMGPIYEGGLFVLARGWHGHHPSRADRGRCRGAGRVG
jgi:hypothetical protein